MAYGMMMFTHLGAPPTLREIMSKYGLTDTEIDPSFGVVQIDP